MRAKPRRVLKPDNFRYLADKVVAPLLQALSCIPHPDQRLSLRRAEHRRRPSLDQATEQVRIDVASPLLQIAHHKQEYRDEAAA